MTKPRYEDVRRKCAMCGRVITGPFGTYRYGISAGMICYDCDAKVTEENRRRRQAIKAKEIKRKTVESDEKKTTRAVKKMYRCGYQPTEIASELCISSSRVYDILNDRR